MVHKPSKIFFSKIAYNPMAYTMMISIIQNHCKGEIHVLQRLLMKMLS